MPRKLLILVLCCIAIGSLVAPAAAQSNQTATATTTATSTPTSSTNSTAILAVDKQTNLVEKSYNRDTGILTLTFETDRYTSISLLAIEDTDASTGSATFQGTNLDPNTRTQVQIQAPPNSRVWISTDLSRRNGEIHFVQTTEGSGIISGPWTATDVRDAAFASAAGVALMVLYRLVLEHSAINKDGERVA